MICLHFYWQYTRTVKTWCCLQPISFWRKRYLSYIRFWLPHVERQFDLGSWVTERSTSNQHTWLTGNTTVDASLSKTVLICHSNCQPIIKKPVKRINAIESIDESQTFLYFSVFKLCFFFFFLVCLFNADPVSSMQCLQSQHALLMFHPFPFSYSSPLH